MIKISNANERARAKIQMEIPYIKSILSDKRGFFAVAVLPLPDADADGVFYVRKHFCLVQLFILLFELLESSLSYVTIRVY